MSDSKPSILSLTEEDYHTTGNYVAGDEPAAKVSGKSYGARGHSKKIAAANKLKEAERLAKEREKEREKDQKKAAPTFNEWIEVQSKGKFKGPHEALTAYQLEFGDIIPGAGLGGGGSEGKAGSGSGGGGLADQAGSGTGKFSKLSEHVQSMKPKNQANKEKKS
ncbi:MAG: hypothetical protein GOVbin4296_51 [Prokaryotic dsDNA virus sp.]|nr:MAG: hypothetical protein GOVbin4296_51 [Prokaryotic dsDNA virus sp.]|tara:strand:+ start:1752 stop:2243 length:492 start_codon:yes stop_codon:yes gene_type:complete